MREKGHKVPRASLARLYLYIIHCTSRHLQLFLLMMSRSFAPHFQRPAEQSLRAGMLLPPRRRRDPFESLPLNFVIKFFHVEEIYQILPLFGLLSRRTPARREHPVLYTLMSNRLYEPHYIYILYKPRPFNFPLNVFGWNLFFAPVN